VEKARQDVSVKEKALEQLQAAADSLALQAEFSGKLLEVADLKVGDPVSVGQKLAKLVDDNTLVLEQYYSYAYEHDIRVGQTASVSIPVVMEQLNGRVVEVNKVNRISAEGSRLFRVVIAVDNPGILTEGMMASACILSGGESLYPYEQSVLEYNETMEVTSKVSGTVAGIHMLDYLDVGAGQLLLEISGDESELALYSAEEALAAAREALTKAEENLANLNAVAPISGTVMGLVISPGQEIAANTAVISIADTSTILVAAQVDERNISFIEQGMSVTVNQWGSEYFGYVESVSLTPEYSGSAAMYPATIVVENAEGRMVTGGSVTYSLVASESEGCLVLPIQCVKYVPNEETGESMSVVFVQTDVRPETAIDIADTSSIGVPEKGYFAVPVETGISDKYNVEILSGLNEGEVVFMNVMRQNSWN
jgi:multidrug efflux pump subunit AcrA (membrane-fusion protein)